MYYAHVLQNYTGKHHSFLFVKRVYCAMQMATHSKFIYKPTKDDACSLLLLA